MTTVNTVGYGDKADERQYYRGDVRAMPVEVLFNIWLGEASDADDWLLAEPRRTAIFLRRVASRVLRLSITENMVNHHLYHQGQDHHCASIGKFLKFEREIHLRFTTVSRSPTSILSSSDSPARVASSLPSPGKVSACARGSSSFSSTASSSRMAVR